jgi:hypothetical protein
MSPPPEIIVTDEEVRPLALGRQRQKQRNERRRRLQAANVTVAQISLFWTFLKKNGFLVLLVLSALINVVFLWEKALMDDDENEESMSISISKQQQSISYPNSQFGICRKLPFSSPQQIWADYLGTSKHKQGD